MDWGGKHYALIMKLAKNDFCYGSSRWKDGAPFNAQKCQDGSLPNEYDCKAPAFDNYGKTRVIRMTSQRNNLVEVSFDEPATPRRLITTIEVGITTIPNFNTWRSVFHSDRTRNPWFQRAGTPGNDDPRHNGRPSGCGKDCMFCYQPSDGNDVNSGMGNNPAYCGAGQSHHCSVGGSWSDNSNRVTVWATITEQ
jgi:hypothetical protein